MRHNTPTRYGSVARLLHWLTALLIIVNLGLGLLAHNLPLDRMALKVQVFSLHKTLGIMALTVAVIRILWALTQTRPAPVHPERRAETLLAEAVHWTLYAAIVLVPVTGWIEHAATEGYAPILWPLGQGLPLVPKSPQLAMAMASVHGALAFLLIGAVLLHVAGALKHALIDRDGVLARMTRGAAAGSGAVLPQGHGAPALLAAALVAGAVGLGWATRATDAAPSDRLARAASDWQVTEGSLGFSVRQMGSEVQGAFSDWTAAISFDPDSGTGAVEVVINMDSVTIGTVTQQAKGADFFDVAAHPVARFQGAIRPEGDAYLAEGMLELRGASMPVTLPFDLQIGPEGLAVMQGATALDRRDWRIGQGYGDESTVGFQVDLQVALRAER